MAKVIGIKGNTVQIGTESGKIANVSINNFNFTPQIGDEVEIYKNNSQLIISKKTVYEENSKSANIIKKQTDDKNSSLGVFALILSIIGCTFVIAVILAIIDLNKEDGKKKTCSKIAIVISGIWLFIGVIASISSNSENDTTYSSKTSYQKDEVNHIKETSEKEKSTKSKTSFEYNKCEVKYIRHEITTNDIGETVLVVYYSFTNNDKDNTHAFSYLVTDKAFQNGVELSYSFWHPNDESKNSEKEIQNGVTITVASSYVLGESRDNVTIEFRPFNIWSDDLLMSLKLGIE